MSLEKVKQTFVWTGNLRAFTLVELLVVIAIIAMMLAILMPALNNAREGAKRLTCGGNLKAIGMASLLYAEDNKGCLPEAYVMHRFPVVENPKKTANGNELAFHVLVRGKYIEQQSRVWRCRSDPKPIIVTTNTDLYPAYTPPVGTYSYHWNQAIGYRELDGGTRIKPFNLNRYRGAGTIPICRDKQFRQSVYPASYMFFQGEIYIPFENHKQAGFNTVFVDGHTSWITRRNFSQYYWGYPQYRYQEGNMSCYEWK